MTLSLPEDAEPFIPRDGGWDHLHNSAVYCLVLDRPDGPESEWDATHDTRPEYWEEFVSAEAVWYVGSAKDVLSRLNDHANKTYRVPVLTEVCEGATLRNIWWCVCDRRKHVERRIADMLAREHPEVFIHQR